MGKYFDQYVSPNKFTHMEGQKIWGAIIRADVIIGTNTVCVGLRYPPIRKIEISKKKKNKRILPDKTGKIVIFGVIKDHCTNYN